jgi:hypothetical protein
MAAPVQAQFHRRRMAEGEILRSPGGGNPASLKITRFMRLCLDFRVRVVMFRATFGKSWR